MTINLFMGTFEDLPDNHECACHETFRSINWFFPRLKIRFSSATRLDEATARFSNELKSKGYDGAYYFSLRLGDKEFYLKGYPYKKK